MGNGVCVRARRRCVKCEVSRNVDAVSTAGRVPESNETTPTTQFTDAAENTEQSMLAVDWRRTCDWMARLRREAMRTQTILGNGNMKEKTERTTSSSAASSGTVSLGGELTNSVRRASEFIIQTRPLLPCEKRSTFLVSCLSAFTGTSNRM
jgi:hypothetical protein